MATTTARASGPALYRDEAGWHALRDGDERAFVVITDGLEHLYLLTRLDPLAVAKNASEIAWLVPIAASADQVSAKPLRDFPFFSGRQPVVQVRAGALSCLELMAASQLWTLPALLLRFWDTALEDGGERLSFFAPATHGVTTEVLSSRGGAPLMENLRSRGIALEGDASPIGASLEGQALAWVLVRVADLAAFRRSNGTSSPEIHLGAAVHFPASRASYPLLSSRQPGPSREIELTISGFVRAAPAPAYEVTTEHYLGTIQAGEEVLRSIRIDPSDRYQRFTRFRWSTKDARAGSDVEQETSADFHFEPGAPTDVVRAAKWLAMPYRAIWQFVAALLVFWTLSLCAHFFARALWAKPSRPAASLGAKMAFANVLTLLGPLFFVRRRAKADGASPRAAVAFILLSSGVLIALLSILHWFIAGMTATPAVANPRL